VTTSSPPRRPRSTIVSAPSRVPTTTGRDSTVWSAFTTKTKGPCCPAWIACEGTTIAVRLVSVRTTSTNWPGHSALFVLAKVALSWIVAVAWSTALLMKVSAPVASVSAWRGARTSTRSEPAARYVLTSPRCCSGIANET
jgi:hypothetical protein